MIIFNIKNLRNKRNLNLTKLSELSGVSRTYLRNLENNKQHNPSLYVLRNISLALEVNMKELFYTELDIPILKNIMYEEIDTFGINSKEVLERSQLIDVLLNGSMNKEG